MILRHHGVFQVSTLRPGNHGAKDRNQLGMVLIVSFEEIAYISPTSFARQIAANRDLTETKLARNLLPESWPASKPRLTTGATAKWAGSACSRRIANPD
jgi:hypothetical protein